MISIDRNIVIPEREIHFDFIRSSGPGGQNVNKVATAAVLRFDVQHSPSLPEEMKVRLLHLAGRRINKEGLLTIHARRFRTQEANRRDAVDRFKGLLQKATQKPKFRRPTEPTLGSQLRRLEKKEHISRQKKAREKVSPSQE